MTESPLSLAVTDLATPLAASLGLELWGVELAFGGRSLVRIFVESDNGVSIDQCAELSRLLGLSLDVEDLMPGAYVLEVSSPGMERTFFTEQQLARAVGQRVEITLHTPKPAWPGRKKFRGLLQKAPAGLSGIASADAVTTASVERFGLASAAAAATAPADVSESAAARAAAAAATADACATATADVCATATADVCADVSAPTTAGALAAVTDEVFALKAEELARPGDYANATVTICHSRTPDLAAECRNADFLFLAMGRPCFVTADMVREGVVVIDVGINRTPEGLCGDADFAGVSAKARAIMQAYGYTF